MISSTTFAGLASAPIRPRRVTWFGPTQQRSKKGIGIDGLSHVIAHSRIEAVLPFLDQRVCCHRNDRQAIAGVAAPESAL